MSAVVLREAMRIPADIADLDSFCRWATSPEYPRHGRYCFLRGELRMDPSGEELFTHNLVKGEFSGVLDPVITSQNIGYFAVDRMLLRNDAAGFATEPDGMFISYAAIESIQVQLVRGADEDVSVIAGTPDMVLEVVSNGSVQKDTVELMELYWLAGVVEYWLVDVRRDSLRFDIFKSGVKGYSSTRRSGGWLKSGVFGKAFRLLQQNDPLGHPQFTLEVR